MAGGLSRRLRTVEPLESRTLLSVAPAAENAPPESSGIPNVIVDEEAPPTVIDLWPIFSDDADPDQALVFALHSMTGTSTSLVQPIFNNAAGTLTLRYAPNTSGNASIVVRATDTQGASSLDAFNITVRAVNDPPVVRVPGPQATPVNTPLVFSQARPGNLIFISDPDVGTAGDLTVTLKVDDGGEGAHGTLTLPRTDGLEFLQGDGEADTLMSFRATVRELSVLAGLRFDPAPGFTGTATLTVTADDQGNTGAGGPLSDTDTVTIQVVGPAAVSVGDAHVLEGDEGTTPVEVTISLAAAHPLPVSVRWATADGTADGGAQAGDHMVNGGFEEPAIESSWAFFGAGSSIGAWVVESGSVDLVTMWEDADGGQSLDLSGAGPGAVYQDVTTVEGESYTLRFALSGNPEVRGEDRVKRVTLDVGGTTLDTLSFDTTGRTFEDMGWEYHDYTFTATSTTTRVRFTSLNDTDTGPAIDDVRLIPAGADDDYRSSFGVVEFAPGETSKTVTVFVNGDTRVEPDETFFVELSEPSGATVRDGRGTVTILNDDEAAPRVTQVFVSSPQWPDAFRRHVEAAGLGVLAFGYGIPAGAGDGARLSQLATLPWLNVGQVSIQFDADVAVAQDDLSVLGERDRAYDVTDFSYDAETQTATWTMSAAIFASDRILIELGSGAKDGVHAAGPGGAALDGEWDNEPDADPAEAYPSGDGEAGGDFRFRFNVLPGDVTGDGRVNGLDVADVRRRLGRVAGDGVTSESAYSVFADVNADTRVNALDLAAVRRRLGAALPQSAASAVPLSPPASTSQLSSITDDLLS